MLVLFYRLLQGERIRKSLFIKEFHIVGRSFDRDIQEIRNLLAEVHAVNELCYDTTKNIYYLTGIENRSLEGNTILPLVFLLMGSQSFTKLEIATLVHALTLPLPPDEQQFVGAVARTMSRGYVEPTHQKPLLKLLWDLGYCIRRKQKILLHYVKQDGFSTDTKVLPIRIAFRDRYFYLIAFKDQSLHAKPAFYRVDRIRSFEPQQEFGKYQEFAAYSWEEDQSAVQFMYAGKRTTTVTLRCQPIALEAVRDRLTNCAIVRQEQDSFILRARVYEEGFLRWVFSQGNGVEVISPEELRQKILERLEEVKKMYQKP